MLRGLIVFLAVAFARSRRWGRRWRKLRSGSITSMADITPSGISRWIGVCLKPVRKMVGLMQKTIELGRREPDAAIDSLLTRSPTLPRDVATQVLKPSFNLIETEATKGHPVGRMSPEVMARAQDVLAQYGQIRAKQPIESYFTNMFIPGS